MKKNRHDDESDDDSSYHSANQEDEKDDLQNMDDNEQIKYNLQNSSKTYLKITHSI